MLNTIMPHGTAFPPRFQPSAQNVSTSENTPSEQKPVLLSSDIDGTLIHWVYKQQYFDPKPLKRNAETIQHNQDKMAVLLNTGRGLSGMKMLAPILKDVPTDYLGVKNGEELYINRNHERTDTWIQHLSIEDRYLPWTNDIQARTGWQPEAVQQAIEQNVLQAGFEPTTHPLFMQPDFDARECQTYIKPTKDNHTTILYRFYDQPNVVLSAMKYDPAKGELIRGITPDDEQIGFELLGALKESLRNQGVHVDSNTFLKDTGDDRTRFYGLLPEGIDKSSLVNGIIRFEQPQTQAVITAGDHPSNDSSTLLKDHFDNQRQEPIPNFPILSGHNPDFLKKFQMLPLGKHIGPGDLSPAIEDDLKTIQKMSPGLTNPFEMALQPA